MSDAIVAAKSNAGRNMARVKWFNPRSGYGFVTDCVSNKDIFVHHSALNTKTEVYHTLNKGEYVEYTLHVDQTGKETAVDVSGVMGGPLQCELQVPREEVQVSRPPANQSRGTGYRGRGGFRGRGRGGSRGYVRGGPRY